VTEEDKDDARHREVISHLKANREQSSLEHGSIVTVVRDQNDATRAHIGSEVETMRGDLAHTKNFVGRLLKAMKRFLERHGMRGDDLDN
jgi:hypothetical protein